MDRYKKARPEIEALEARNLPSVSSPFNISNSIQYDEAPATASSAKGMSVVVWGKEDGNGHEDSFAQLFDSTHNQVGSDIAVTNNNDNAFAPDVAMDAHGNFVVVWIRDVNNTHVDFDVQFALFNNAGALVKMGDVLASGDQEFNPHVAMSDAGTFVVSLTRGINFHDDLLAQRFDAAGTALGKPIKVGANAKLDEWDEHLDMAANGRFAIAYQRDAVNGSGQDIFLARYFANGALQGKTKIAHVDGSGNANLDVGITNTGRCAVVFDRGLSSGADESVYLRTLSGATLSAAKVLTSSSDYESTPQIAINRTTGDFVLAYRHVKANGDHVAVREYAKDGTPKEAEHDLGVDTLNAAISLDGIDRYFVAFEYAFSASDHDVHGAYGLLV